MSALRISIPGHPTTLVDLGPSVGRRSFSRTPIFYGSPAVAVSPPRPQETDSQLERSRAAARRYYDLHREEVRARQNRRRAEGKSS